MLTAAHVLAVVAPLAVVVLGALAHDIARRRLAADSSSELVRLRVEIANLARDLTEEIARATEAEANLAHRVTQVSNRNQVLPSLQGMSRKRTG